MNTELSWQSLRQRLEGLKRTVAEEIGRYPPPIPACDAEFNRLLELRQLLPRELARLDLAATDNSATIEDFIRASPCQSALSALLPDS